MSSRIKKGRLINKPRIATGGTLTDCFLSIAANIEDSLVMAGAEPGKDYSFLDIYKLAQPFVLHRFVKDGLRYTQEWGEDV